MIVVEHSDQPKYEQIYEQLKEQLINATVLRPGSRLQSTRELAKTLCVSRNTVMMAYEQLYAEGYLEKRERQGYFASNCDLTMLEDQKIVQEPFFSVNSDAESMDHNPYDFRPRRIDLSRFPFPLWNRLLSRAVNDFQDRFYSYGHPQGGTSLRSEIAKYVNWHRGITCIPQQIVLFDGTQQAITMLCRLLQDEVKVAAIEEPGNFGARVVFQNAGLPVLPITVRRDGLDVKELFKTEADLVYVTPSRQFPSGHVMSVGQRIQLLEWAKKRDAYIIEDDFNCFFRFRTGPIPALKGTDGSGRVIYLGSFAQAVFPAARITFIILPVGLLPRYNQLYEHYDSPVPVLLQKTMELFLSEGHFERHLRKMNQHYKKKYELIIKTLQEELGGFASVQNTDAGLHVLLTVRGEDSEETLIRKAEAEGVKIGSIKRHYINPPQQEAPVLLLSFGWIRAEEIVPAIALLKKAWVKSI